MEQVEPVKCVSEEEALSAFLTFLETVGPCVVLVGLDEETLGVLLQKVEDKDTAKFRSLVVGYTWWERVFANANITLK